MQLLTLLLLFWSFQATSDLSPGQGKETGAVNRIALSFTGENPSTITDDLFQTAIKIGINLLETDRPGELREHNTDSFLLLLSVDQKFMTPDKIRVNWREIATDAIESYQLGETIFPGRVVAINLFQYPDDRSERFFEYSSLISDTLKSVTDLPLYYQTSPASSSEVYLPYRFKSFTYSDQLPSLSISGNVIHFSPSDQLDESLLLLETIFAALNETSESVIIIPAGWLYQLLEKYPDMSLIFSSYISGELMPFPIPDVPTPAPTLNLPVFLLLSIWAGFLVLYKQRPMFIDKCLRYFLNHKFFVQDIFQNRNRNLADGFYLLTLHMLISALFFYTISLLFFGLNGLKVFSSHYTYIFFENYESVSFLIFGFVATALLHTISVFWLYIFNKKLKRVSQIMNLYSWGFALNLILVTILVFSYLFDWGALSALFLTLIYFLVWFFTFNIAAVHSARTMDSFKLPYILLTIGLHTALIIFLFTLLMMEVQFLESLSLAHWLSK